MNPYVKPIIKLSGTAGTSAGSCSYQLTDDDLALIEAIIGSEINMKTAFGMYEACADKIQFENYCKFTSGELGATMAFGS